MHGKCEASLGHMMERGGGEMKRGRQGVKLCVGVESMLAVFLKHIVLGLWTDTATSCLD